MKTTPFATFVLAGVFCALWAGIASAVDTLPTETSQANTNTPNALDVQRTYVQLQQQMHALQLAIERSQQDAQAAARRNADDMTASIQLLEQSLNLRREGELETMQRTNQATLLVAGTFAIIVLIAMLFTAYFQWRVAHRLADLSSANPALPIPASGRSLPETAAGSGQSLANPAAEQTNARLLRVMSQLQQRILKYEQTARAPQKKIPAPANKT